MIKFAVEKRWSSEVAFTAEIDCAEDAPRSWKLRLAVLWAIESKANLSEADLSWANLSKADLSKANLSEADLSWANLSKADLSKANLSKADLSEANLSKANLSEADLSEANLSEADLSWANLSKADLSKANLSWANLSEADLSWANLSGAARYIKHDIWAVCLHAKKEVPNLLSALKEGRVDGSQYEGECRCLCGTLEGSGPALPVRDAASMAERWFMGISKGHTPENNPVSKITVEWIEEFLRIQEAA